MNRAAILRRATMLALVVAVQLNAEMSSAALSFSNSSLKGRWSVQFGPATSFGSSALGNPAGVTAAPRQHVLRVGYIDWDGLGAAAGRFIALTDTNSGQTMTIDYKWTGTYAVNTDGTGSLTISAIELLAPVPVCTPDPPPEGGVCTDYIAPSPASPVPQYVPVETFQFSIGIRYKTVYLVQQSTIVGSKILLAGEAISQIRSATPYFFTTGSLKRRWSFQLEPATGFAAIDPVDPGGVAGAPRQDVLRVGFINFDGFGQVTGRTIATTEDNTGTPVIIDFNWVGSYTVNSDGTGTLSMSPALLSDSNCTPAQAPGVCATFEGPETYAFAISRLSQRIFLMQTDNVGGGAKLFMHGAAKIQ